MLVIIRRENAIQDWLKGVPLRKRFLHQTYMKKLKMKKLKMKKLKMKKLRMKKLKMKKVKMKKLKMKRLRIKLLLQTESVRTKTHPAMHQLKKQTQS